MLDLLHFLLGSAMISSFCVGISMSSTRSTGRRAWRSVKPVYISLSAKITVSRRPQRRKASLMSLEISFFFSALLISANGSPAGRISDSSARPTVVS